ncbi:hypothetical protein EPA93_27335 [Ktedonosporobacter rubrisoli]|uniref:ABM domain-containing protein n=1 Tax=Ktedonosporobacter rubrisoli TaxID=2509675 RepID=A0A4P6JVV0_KTERU|nr:antibiotic biosynthesis monooxygenase [Ktedonosporobacter rubrisoli]QBD79492.1 hypothetical protein EPA93_27335 [Ktedonosporobacter rubrisoli]
MPELTLIVPFEVPPGQEEDMRRQWHAVAEPLSQAPGFISARLYAVDHELEQYLADKQGLRWLEQRPQGRARFSFVNIARWESLERYEAAIRQPSRGKPIAYPNYPAYYRLARLTGVSAGESMAWQPASKSAFTFIVPFAVPTGQEEEMRRQFSAIVTSMEEIGRPPGSFGPGLLELDPQVEARLRNFLSEQLGQQESRPEFNFFNIAEWESPERYVAAIQAMHSRTRPISFTSFPAYYRVVGAYSGPGKGAETA